MGRAAVRSLRRASATSSPTASAAMATKRCGFIRRRRASGCSTSAAGSATRPSRSRRSSAPRARRSASTPRRASSRRPCPRRRRRRCATRASWWPTLSRRLPVEQRFDRAFSRFGTMFFANPVAALRNVHAALVPGGELTMVVWRAAGRQRVALPRAADRRAVRAAPRGVRRAHLRTRPVLDGGRRHDERRPAARGLQRHRLPSLRPPDPDRARHRRGRRVRDGHRPGRGDPAARGRPRGAPARRHPRRAARRAVGVRRALRRQGAGVDLDRRRARRRARRPRAPPPPGGGGDRAARRSGCSRRRSAPPAARRGSRASPAPPARPLQGSARRARSRTGAAGR